MDNTIDERLDIGINLFNEGKFYECHDVIEDIWFEIRDDTRELYQGLIHLAVGFHHITIRDNAIGGISQLKKCAAKLDAYKPEYNGILISDLLDKVNLCINELKSYNKTDIFTFDKNKIPKIIRIKSAGN